MLREAALLPFLLVPLASVAALGCGGSATREAACPQGSHREGPLCVADVVACPEVASSTDGACKPGANPPTGPARSPCRDLAECRAGCATDHVASCTRVGALLQDAGDAAEDERRRVLTRACDGEDPEGCFRLGLLADTPDARSTELFAFACERGVAGGCTELGFSLRAGRGTPSVDHPRARELYQRGCDGGHAVGCTNLGVMQADGEGGARDVPGAVRAFRKGCEGGHARGCTYWGRHLANGDGVPKDEPAAVEAYRRACDGDDGDGCNDLGVRAMEGRGMTKDVALALHSYDKACQRESAVGCLNLARSWLDGRQPGVNEANAIELFYRSCTLAEEDACDELSRTVARLRDVCEKGGPNHGGHCLNLGWVAERGLGVEHDVARAVALYKKACGAGVGQGCFNLGVMQAEGRGAARAEKAARVSFQKGCKLDHAPACARAERR